MAFKVAIEKHLVCPICLDVFKTPKTLPCVHSFCLSCLRNHITTGKTTFTDGGLCFECPVCRKQTFPVKKSASIFEWAKDFPSNHFIVSVMEESSAASEKELDNTSVENSELKCVPCSEDGKNSFAFGFCTSCIEHLCKNCYQDHKRLKSTRNHIILKGNEMPIDTDVFKKMSSLSRCMSHPDREVEFRCSHHKTFACPMCLRDAHRYCSRIEPIERIEQKDRDTHLLKFIFKLKSVKESAETLIATNKKIQQENTTQAVEMIWHRYNIIINRLKGLTHFLECDFSMEFHEILESETAKLSVNDAASSDLIKAINGDLSLAESLNKYGSDLQIAVQNNKIDNTLTNRTEELSKLENSLKFIQKSNVVSEKLESTVMAMESGLPWLKINWKTCNTLFINILKTEILRIVSQMERMTKLRIL